MTNLQFIVELRLIRLITFLLVQTCNQGAIPTTKNQPKIIRNREIIAFKCCGMSQQQMCVLQCICIWFTCVLEVLEHSNLRP